LNSSDGASDGAFDDGSAARFLCVKLPLQNLHYGDWHLADHSLVKNMPCSEKMRDTKLIWLNKINLVESAAHMLALPGGKKATRMEWVDADLYAERDDLAANLGGARGRGLTLEDLFQWKPIPQRVRRARSRRAGSGGDRASERRRGDARGGGGGGGGRLRVRRRGREASSRVSRSSPGSPTAGRRRDSFPRTS
jgi:hypothetical protein